MACGACSKKRRTPPNINVSDPTEYNLTGGVDVRSLNNKQIQARLEVFKRKFCKTCSSRYECTYSTYLECKGAQPK